MNLDRAQARRRFAAARSAHLATADGEGRPHIVPVTFACACAGEDGDEGDRVYIAVDSKPKRSTDLKRLRNIHANPSVALLADEYDDDWSRLWWVRGDGSARVLTDEADRRGPVELLKGRYPQYLANVPEGPVIEVSISRWSGWAFVG